MSGLKTLPVGVSGSLSILCPSNLSSNVVPRVSSVWEASQDV